MYNPIQSHAVMSTFKNVLNKTHNQMVKLYDIPGQHSQTNCHFLPSFPTTQWGHQTSLLTLPPGNTELQNTGLYSQPTHLDLSSTSQGITDLSANESDGVSIRYIKRTKQRWTRGQRESVRKRRTHATFLNNIQSLSASQLDSKSGNQESPKPLSGLCSTYYSIQSKDFSSNNRSSEYNKRNIFYSINNF